MDSDIAAQLCSLETIVVPELREENAKLRDLLGRIAWAIDTGMIDIPDVAHAIFAELDELGIKPT